MFESTAHLLWFCMAMPNQSSVGKKKKNIAAVHFTTIPYEPHAAHKVQ